MIRIRRRPLPSTTQTDLASYQRLVDDKPDYASQVTAAKVLFKRRNTPDDRVFAEVRGTLVFMCHGARRCMYCEDAPADEVEHFAPKDLFPELAFTWPNYLYSCGICNSPKSNKWGILPRGGSGVVDVARPRNAAVVPPLSGAPALIDPSLVNPLRFLTMDLRDTFLIVPLPPAGTSAHTRAEYTIDVLKLNKDFLVASRATAFEAYVSHLARAAQSTASKERKTVRAAIRNTPHPTVWAEMKRQRYRYTNLDAYFNVVPAALKW